MGIMISIGKWGGFYLAKHAFAPRLCLGWIAITIFRCDGDDILALAVEGSKHIQESGRD